MNIIWCIHKWTYWHTMSGPFRGYAPDGIIIPVASPETRYCYLCKHWQVKRFFWWRDWGDMFPLGVVEILCS